MIGASAAYMSGLFFASFFTGMREILLLAAVSAVVAAIGARMGFRRGDYVMLAVSFAIACGASAYNNRFIYSRITAFDGTTGNFSGEVVDIKHYDREKAVYLLDGTINGSVRAKVTYYGTDLFPRYGDILNIYDGVFAKVQGDYLFDIESYYKSQKVFLQVGNAENVTLISKNSRNLKNFLSDYRERMTSEFCLKTGGESGNFLAGMIFGEKQSVDPDIKNSLYRVGIGHILSVSGLHVSIIALAFMAVFSLLRINKYVSFGLTNVLMAMLVLMANSPISAIRAVIMMDFICSAKLFRRQNDTLNSLAAAALIICLVNPYAIFSSGFMLSLSGTFGIGVFGPFMVKNIPSSNAAYRFLRSIALMICTTLSVLPFSLLYFGEISLISPISNIVMIPMCTFAMLLGIAYVLSGGLIPVIEFAGMTVKLVIHIADKLSRLRFIYLSSPGKEVITIVFGAALIVLIVYFMLKSRTAVCIACAAACSVSLISSVVRRNIRSRYCIAAVVGRGSDMAIVVSNRGNTDIIDLSGNYRNSDYVRKYLRDNGEDHVSDVILTENVHSQYSAYFEDIESADEWILCTNVLTAGEKKVRAVGNSSFTIEHSDCIVEYADHAVKLTCGGQTVVFAPIKSEIMTDDGVTVLYGNIPKNSELSESDSVIYTDIRRESGVNNFEIILAENGDYKIRRL